MVRIYCDFSDSYFFTELVWRYTIIGKESFSTLHLYELNGSAVPQGNRISLTKEDFEEFPQLASIIQDKNKNPTRIFDDGKRFYLIPLTSIEMNRFNSRYWLNSSGEDRRFFEDMGKYYEYNTHEIHQQFL
jgi:hypothetical protein